jgi:hypothetical protein
MRKFDPGVAAHLLMSSAEAEAGLIIKTSQGFHTSLSAAEVAQRRASAAKRSAELRTQPTELKDVFTPDQVTVLEATFRKSIT